MRYVFRTEKHFLRKREKELTREESKKGGKGDQVTSCCQLDYIDVVICHPVMKISHVCVFRKHARAPRARTLRRNALLIKCTMWIIGITYRADNYGDSTIYRRQTAERILYAPGAASRVQTRSVMSSLRSAFGLKTQSVVSLLFLFSSFKSTGATYRYTDVQTDTREMRPRLFYKRDKVRDTLIT